MHVCEWRERREEEERKGKQNIHVSRERGNVRKKGRGTRAEGGTMATGEKARDGWREGRKRGRKRWGTAPRFARNYTTYRLTDLPTDLRATTHTDT